MVIRAFVLARLLGLRVLTLDACVVIDDDDSPARRVPARLLGARREISGRSAVPALTSSIPGQGKSLARALRLLEQGVHTLEQSQRDRLPPGCPEIEAEPAQLR
jgi:hypothetical protein